MKCFYLLPKILAQLIVNENEHWTCFNYLQTWSFTATLNFRKELLKLILFFLPFDEKYSSSSISKFQPSGRKLRKIQKLNNGTFFKPKMASREIWFGWSGTFSKSGETKILVKSKKRDVTAWKTEREKRNKETKILRLIQLGYGACLAQASSRRLRFSRSVRIDSARRFRIGLTWKDIGEDCWMF